MLIRLVLHVSEGLGADGGLELRSLAQGKRESFAQQASRSKRHSLEPMTKLATVDCQSFRFYATYSVLTLKRPLSRSGTRRKHARHQSNLQWLIVNQLAEPPYLYI